MQRSTSRRRFLKAGAATLTLRAASTGQVLGANDRIAIGVIGCGQRGFKAHMTGVNKHAKSQNMEITAVADPWRPHRERAAAQAKEWYGRAARSFVSYRDVIALKDVDAVMIASCDHQHTAHLEAAAQAKKDVYIEKPLAMDLDRLNVAYDAVKASRIVVQVGTQLRSYASFTGCRALYQTGALGRVSRIEQRRNSTQPYWYSRLKDAQPGDVDWSEFIMHLPKRPFRADLFTGWYGYRDFSGGPVPGLGSHFIDLVHYITGARFPASATGQHATFTWKDKHGFTCPDHVQATWIYPEGFMVSYSTNFGNASSNLFRIYGTKGVMDMTNWTKPFSSGEGAAEKGAVKAHAPVEPVSRPDHFLDWLLCLRSRKTPNASIDAGYRHAVAVIMAVQAADTGRRQIFDEKKREIRAG